MSDPSEKAFCSFRSENTMKEEKEKLSSSLEETKCIGN